MLQNSIFNSSKVVDLRALVLLLRDHGTLTPVAFCPAALIGCDGSREDKSRFNARPVTTQKYHYHFVPVIASLRLQSWFWLIPVIALPLSEGLRAVEVNLAWNFNSSTSNVPYGLVIFSCQGPVKSEKLSLHLYWTEKPFCQGCFLRKFENVILKGPICPKTVTNRDQVIAQALFDKNFGMLTVNLVISDLAE